MPGSNGTRYAIAVREGDSLFLFMWARHTPKGEFFVMLPRPHDTQIDAHASYHADGTSHIKTHEKLGLPKIMRPRRQRPDQHFVGTAHLLDQTITPKRARAIGVPCDPTAYTAVFEIPITDFRVGQVITNVTTDVVSPGYSPQLAPGVRVIRQQVYQDGFPFIVITLYEVDLL